MLISHLIDETGVSNNAIPIALVDRDSPDAYRAVLFRGGRVTAHAVS